jgi:hypothetical protein
MQHHFCSFGRAAVRHAVAWGVALNLLTPGLALAQVGPDAESVPRSFADTGYQISDDNVWTFFNQHGGSAVFGEPISREFTLYGSPVQLFERAALQVQSDGSVQVMQLTAPAFLPYTHLAGLTVPAADPALALVTPGPEQSNYASRLTEFLRATVPETWNGRPVAFSSTLIGQGVDVWGVPTSAPTVDPRNPRFVYQRFADGILLYDATSGTTTALPLGEYFKDLLTGQNLPSDLAAEAATSQLMALYDAAAPLSLARPEAVADTDLTDAFTPDVN